jgi:eukaryotic-like serine/threonine-protein kinase
MKIKMSVIEGSGIGTSYEFESEEADNILVGREDVDCKAKWRLSKADRSVSRAQFILEVRPPNVQLMDPLSANGTYLFRGDAPKKKVEEVLLEDGDILLVGKTRLQMAIEIPLVPIKTQILSDRLISSQPGSMVEVRCIRCGRLITMPPSFKLDELEDEEFLCDTCQKELEKRKEKTPPKKKEPKAEVEKKPYTCMKCGSSLAEIADRDGKAQELADVALYLCSRCAAKEVDPKQREKNIGDYQVLSKIGEGGMGIVYKVRDTKTSRVAALKITKAKLNDPDRRFLREIDILKRLAHPNLVRFYESGKHQGKPFFVSEFVSGGDLSQFVSADGKTLLGCEEAVRLIAESLVGLDFFHNSDRKYVHRDLKPENILLSTRDGQKVPKLTDLGLSKSYETHGGTITKTGQFAGTWMYMPPEQVRFFKDSKPLVDIYAMGVTLYYLLTADYPLDFPPTWKIKKWLKEGKLSKLVAKRDPVNMVLYDGREPIETKDKNLPASLCKVINKSMSSDPERRYQTAEEFRQALLEVI